MTRLRIFNPPRRLKGQNVTRIRTTPLATARLDIVMKIELFPARAPLVGKLFPKCKTILILLFVNDVMKIQTTLANAAQQVRP